ncbi:MAG: ATP-binding cassette domain-containing protein [Acidobacteriaceae bacterium]|nr:ATP-binding cassette domain-containing protein [Acidobacteriaceae bacterium]
MAEFPVHHLAVRADVGGLKVSAELRLHEPWTVLFGPSGSGKSTVLRAAAGLIPQAEVKFSRVEDGGTVELAGLVPEKRGLSYAPQGAALFPHMSVRENVWFGLLACDDPLGFAVLPEQSASLLRVHVLRDRRPSELSGGERQRVALARAFAKPQTKLLLLDEPFAGLDRAMRDELLPEMLAWTRERGIAVLSVTHDVDEALLLGAQVLQMDSGKIIAAGPAREVLAEERERVLRALR